MKNYTVTYAEDVPHYTSVTIEANNDGAALDLAKKYDFGNEALEAEWESAVCSRIVYIEDDEGKTILSDVPLDKYRLHHLERPVGDGYSVGITDGGQPSIKLDDKLLAILCTPESDLLPLVHAGNCHAHLLNALKRLRECIQTLPITIMNGPFYDAMLTADQALGKASAA